MIDGIYNNSTKIFFGKGSEKYLGEETLKYSKNILLVYGRQSCKQTGVYDKIVKILHDNDITYIELTEIQPNPTTEKVEEGITLCNKHNIDFILAVGGGSVIDTAKIIVLKSDNNRKIATVLTVPGSGSESNPHAIIIEALNKEKISHTHECMRPVFSILNPEFTLSLAPKQTSVGILDSIVHVLEKYFTNIDYVKCSDGMCLNIIETLIYYYDLIKTDPNNYDIRAEIMWACKLANDDTLCLGRKADWSSHAIAHELNSYYPAVPHGNLAYIIFLAWIEYIKQINYKYFDEFLFRNQTLQRLLQESELYTDLESIDHNINELFPEIAVKCCSKTQSGTIGNFVRLTNKDIEAILSIAY